MTTGGGAEPVGSLLVISLDEEQTRARARERSSIDARVWHVIRTPAGHHVVLTAGDIPPAPSDYAIVATYHKGKEV